MRRAGDRQSANDADEVGELDDPAYAGLSPRGLAHLEGELRKVGRLMDLIDVITDEER